MGNTAVETELLQLERRYWQALKDLDTDTALRLTDDACIIAGAQGVSRVDKRTVAEMMRSPRYTLNSFELLDGAQVQQLADGVAVLAYRVRETLTVEGKPVTMEAAETSTWVRRDGTWRCALHTESMLGDPFGRDRSAKPS